MQMDSPPLTLTVPSDLRMMSVARAFVEAVCQIGSLDKNTTHAVVLATGEAISNIIRHAHCDRPQAQIQIQCRLVSNGVELFFHDEGEPFDVAAVPHLNPGELRVGGRGIFLMRALMDELWTSRRPEGGNTLRMCKHRSTGHAVRDCG